jgi:hypothetical protein
LVDHADFAVMFRDGATISDDEGLLATMRVQPLGGLIAPSGAIVACDPLTAIEPKPFAQRIAPGRYPILLSVARLANGDERVACAQLRLSDAPVARWEMARLESQEQITLDADEFFGYGVDAGVGCFMDARAASALDAHYERDESYDEALIDAMEAHRTESWDYANVALDEVSGLNVVMFSSGWGDGVFASYWGYDASGAPVCLVTDFSLF